MKESLSHVGKKFKTKELPFRSEQTARPSETFVKINQNILIFSNWCRVEWWEKVGQGFEEAVRLLDVFFIFG